MTRPEAARWTDDDAWRGTRAEVGRATGLDPALYTDPGVHELELDRLFARAWVCVGLTAELTAGRLLVRAVGSRSVLVTRDVDGGVRAFLNSCRHRGTELAEADCTVRGTIRCPYHRWTYALDGTLTSAPRFDLEARVDDVGDLGLVAVRVGTCAGLVFVCLDQRTPSLETWLGDLPERLTGYHLDTWTIADGIEIDVAANWKLVVENFQECYHLPGVHPALATVSRVRDHYRYQGPGMYSGQTTTPVSDGDGSTWLSLPPVAGLDPSDAVSGRFVAIVPNVLVSVLPNHAFVMRLSPQGPAHTRESCTWLLPPSDDDPDGRSGMAAEAGFATIRRFWLDVNAEDIDIVQRSQRGLSAGRVAPGPLVPRFEEPLHRFHNILADHFTVADPGQIPVPPGDDPNTNLLAGVDARPNPSPPLVERAAAPRPKETMS